MGGGVGGWGRAGGWGRWGGLVSRVGPAGSAGKVAQGAAEAVATRGPIATRLAKEAVWRGLDQPLEQALRFETDLTLLLQATKDRAEGVRAFLEKRPPEFPGKVSSDLPSWHPWWDEAGETY